MPLTFNLFFFFCGFFLFSSQCHYTVTCPPSPVPARLPLEKLPANRCINPVQICITNETNANSILHTSQQAVAFPKLDLVPIVFDKRDWSKLQMCRLELTKEMRLYDNQKQQFLIGSVSGASAKNYELLIIIDSAAQNRMCSSPRKTKKTCLSFVNQLHA